MTLTSERYTIDQAAEHLGCSRWTLRDQVTRGEVPHHRSGRVKGVYFTQDDLDAILGEHVRAVQPAQQTTKPVKSRPVARAKAPIPAEFAKLKRAS